MPSRVEDPKRADGGDAEALNPGRLRPVTDESRVDDRDALTARRRWSRIHGYDAAAEGPDLRPVRIHARVESDRAALGREPRERRDLVSLRFDAKALLVES